MTAIREDHAVPAPRVDVAEETRAEIRRAVAALTAVPTDYRAFARSAQHARNVHNIPAHLLAAAVECGLPTVGPADDLIFDDRDLTNLSAALRRRSVWYLGQVGFKAALKDLREGNRVTYDVAYQARCPYPGHRGSCDFHYLFEAGPHDGSTAGAVGVLSGPNQLRVTTSGSTQGAPTRVQDVLRCLDGVEYLHLPPVLSRDLDFLDRAGQANCLLAAAALLREARRLKVAARSSFGLLLVPPYAGVHTWVEFQVDDQWVAFDPHLIRLMEKAGVLSPGQWPETSSLSGMLLRWAAINQATGRHGPNHAEVSYALKKVT